LGALQLVVYVCAVRGACQPHRTPVQGVQTLGAGGLSLTLGWNRKWLYVFYPFDSNLGVCDPEDSVHQLASQGRVTLSSE